MRKDQEVIELAGHQLRELAEGLGKSEWMHRSGPWVTMRINNRDGSVYLEVRERGYLAAINAIEQAQQEIEQNGTV